MKNTLSGRNRIVHLCSCIAIYLIAVLFAILSVASILQTCRIDKANPYSELITFDNDLVLTNLSLIGLTILAALVILRKKISIGKVNTHFVVGVMLLVTTIVSLAWINMVKSITNGNEMVLLNTARDAANNMYSGFQGSGDNYNNSYFLYNPYQMGYVFFAEILYRIFGTGCSDILLQIPNVIALDFIYVGIVMTTGKLFDRSSITNLTAIVLTVFLQPMFITTFTNSVMTGLAFSVWSVYHVIRYMQEHRIKNAVFAAILMAVSVTLKYNNMIVLAAVCIALILHTVDKKKFFALALAGVMTLCSFGLPRLVVLSYSARSGVELNTHITPTVHAYSGICDSGMAPGWYNGKAAETLRDNNMDVEAANQAASKGISDRLTYLTTNHKLLDFYKQKLLSQFNEPSYQSIWVSQVRSHDYPEGEKLPALVLSVYNGGLQTLLDNWFNFGTMMIFIFFTAGMIWLIIGKKLNTATLILPLTVLGGVLYHLIFEGKSQFVLPYIVMLIPFAVFGFTESMRALSKKTDILFK